MRAVQMDNLRLLGIRRMDRIPNARIRELCGVRKGLDERINEDVLRWFGHVERMERDRIFESGVPEYWRSAVIVPLCVGKGEKT